MKRFIGWITGNSYQPSNHYISPLCMAREVAMLVHKKKPLRIRKKETIILLPKIKHRTVGNREIVEFIYEPTRAAIEFNKLEALMSLDDFSKKYLKKVAEKLYQP